MRPTIEALRHITLFAAFSIQTLARIAEVSHTRVYQTGETVIFEGDPAEAAYFISRGRVRVYRLSPQGRQQVLARLGPGQAFNTVPPFVPFRESSSRSQVVNHATVEALERAELYIISTKDLRHLVAACPDMASALLQDFAQRLNHLTDLVEDLSLRTVRGRLARFLVVQAGEGDVARRWTQEEIAAHLGTVRDMVGRSLRAFADADLLRMERERIILLDREGLMAEVER